MFTGNNIIEIGGLAATAVNFFQSQSIHEQETSHAEKRHEESMALAKKQHEEDLKIAKQTYLMAAFTSLEQHFQVDVFHYRVDIQFITVLCRQPSNS